MPSSRARTSSATRLLHPGDAVTTVHSNLRAAHAVLHLVSLPTFSACAAQETLDRMSTPALANLGQQRAVCSELPRRHLLAPAHEARERRLQHMLAAAQLPQQRVARGQQLARLRRLRAAQPTQRGLSARPRGLLVLQRQPRAAQRTLRVGQYHGRALACSRAALRCGAARGLTALKIRMRQVFCVCQRK